MKTFLRVWRLAKFFVEWEMFSTKVVEKIKTHILCRVTFFPRKSCRLWDNVEKYDGARGATNDVTIWRIWVACWISKATCTLACTLPRTHTEYVIFMILERASVFRYTHIACLVWVFDIVKPKTFVWRVKPLLWNSCRHVMKSSWEGSHCVCLNMAALSHVSTSIQTPVTWPAIGYFCVTVVEQLQFWAKYRWYVCWFGLVIWHASETVYTTLVTWVLSRVSFTSFRFFYIVVLDLIVFVGVS